MRTDTVTIERRLRLPWGAWTGASVALRVPEAWELIELAMRDAPALSGEAIDAALDRPVGSPPLEALVTSQSRVAIAVDDITRPTRSAPLLARIVRRLEAAGATRESITVIVATGAHRAATENDIRLKVGEVAGRVRVISHDPAADLAETSATLGGQPVRVNREFLAADVRLGICGVMPHPFAGFSGGGKIVLPGLSDLDGVVRSHKYALMGFGGGLQLEGNRFRADMERAVRDIGLHWTANVVMNSRCEVAALVAGNLEDAHRVAAEHAREIGATAPPAKLLDALLLNAYPKDSELLQVEAALVAARAGMTEWLTEAAPIVLIGACPDGLGSHRLFGPGGRLFRKPTTKGFLRNRVLHVVSPATAADTDRAAFCDAYPYHADWDSCLAALAPALPAAPVIGYAANGPLHVPWIGHRPGRTEARR